MAGKGGDENAIKSRQFWGDQREKNQAAIYRLGKLRLLSIRQHSFSLLFFSRAASLCQIGFNQIQFSRYNKINSDI